MRRATLGLVGMLALTGALPLGPATALPGAPADPGEGRAIPLRDEAPSWLTGDLAAEVRRADGGAVDPPPDAPLPGTVGIRPGTWMIDPYLCTLNFVFRDGAARGIGTAGHCVDGLGQSVVALTLHPESEVPVLVEVGTVVARRNGGLGDDFALIRIHPALRGWVSPTIAAVAGPCRAYRGSDPQVVSHYGHGYGIGTGGTPRTGVALQWYRDHYLWDGAAIHGDSGSPVRIGDLRAAGNLTHLLVGARWLPGVLGGTRIGRMDEIAAGWTLVPSSICPSLPDPWL